MSLKALSQAVLQGNLQGNQMETLGFLAGQPKETKITREETLSLPAQSNLNKPDLTGRNQAGIGRATTETELFNLIRSAFEQIDLAGRPWTGWRKSLIPEKRRQVMEIERRIDSTFAAFDRDGLLAALDDYKSLTITNKY